MAGLVNDLPSSRLQRSQNMSHPEFDTVGKVVRLLFCLQAVWEKRNFSFDNYAFGAMDVVLWRCVYGAHWGTRNETFRMRIVYAEQNILSSVDRWPIYFLDFSHFLGYTRP